jgi:undecaprenyl pyrophosphate phosphatase UppP
MVCCRMNFIVTLPSLLICLLARLFDQLGRRFHGGFVALLVGVIRDWLFCWLAIKLLMLLVNYSAICHLISYLIRYLLL